VEDVSFPPKIKWQPQHLEGAKFRRVSFEGPVISGPPFRRASLRDCVFEGVDFGGLRVRKTDFRDCRFEECSFGHTSVGVFEDSSLLNCSVIHGRIDHLTFVRSTFKGCAIEVTKAATVRWESCVLEDVTLSGIFDGATFVGNTLTRVDLSATELRDSAILDCVDADVVLPDRPSNFTVSPEVLLRAESTLRGRLDEEDLDSYKRFSKAYGQMGPIVIVSETLYPELGPIERELVLSTLYELRKA